MRNPEYFFDLFVDLVRAAENLSEDSNEAVVRLEIIDRILDEVLGWSKTDFNPEYRTQTGTYTDYLLTSHNERFVVVEAKRAGRVFRIPEKYRKREYKAGRLCAMAGPELRDAMRQAASYCNTTGTHFAVVTNGHQWIVFRGQAKDNRGWGGFPAVVFNNAEVLENHYLEFWNLLSKEQVVREGTLNLHFDDPMMPPPAFVGTPNSRVQNQRRSPLTERHNVTVLLEYYFSDIVDRDNGAMLEHCFVEDIDIHEYNKDLQSLLKEELILLKDEVDSEKLTAKSILEAVERPTSESKARIVLVVGQVGAGKTTFLRRFFKTIEKESGYARFILDLLPESKAVVQPRSDEPSRLSKRILDALESRYSSRNGFGEEYNPYARTTLRTIYGGIAARLKDINAPIYKDNPDQFEKDLSARLDEKTREPEDLLPKYMSYLSRRTGRPFCLAFDNVDRATTEYQHFVYTFAHELGAKVPGIIVISLRDTTYLQAKAAGFLDTRISDVVFQLSPPNLKSVVSKRLKYMKHQVDNPDSMNKRLRGYKEFFEEKGAYLKQLLLTEDETARYLLTCLSNRSVRRAFWLIQQYALSPRAWQTYQEGSAGNHLLQTLMLGRNNVYRQGESATIINIYSVSIELRGSYLLPTMLLSYLDWVRQEGSGRSELSEVGHMLRSFESWGVPRPLSLAVLSRLTAQGLIESSNQFIGIPGEQQMYLPTVGDIDVDYGDKLRISPSGYYYLNDMVNDSEYQVLCAGDTCWYEEGAFTEFCSEYLTAAELVATPPYDCELYLESDCLELWKSYLSREWEREQQALATHQGIAWRVAVYRSISKLVPSIDEIVGVPAMLSSSGDSQETTQPKQIVLFGKGEYDENLAIRSALCHLPGIGDQTKINGSSYLARVLWALELAHRARLGPLMPSKMAELLQSWGGLQVEPPNVARFLRTSESKKSHYGLWTVKEVSRRSKVYQITVDGRRRLKRELSSPATESEE